MSNSENIQVALRFRPLNQRELSESEERIWHTSGEAVVLKNDHQNYLMEEKRINAPIRTYSYNNVYTERHTNERVYNTTVKQVVMSSLQGYNGTIFAYGQTGSGKTFTMMGTDGTEIEKLIEDKTLRLSLDRRITKMTSRNGSNSSSESNTPQRTPSPKNNSNARQTPTSAQKLLRKKPSMPMFQDASNQQKGVIHYALQDIFFYMQENKDKTFVLKCSYMEIYNEMVYDLLKDQDEFKSESLTVSEDATKGFHVKGLTEYDVSNMEEIMTYLEKGETNRHYAATSMNHHSSRSHTIFRLSVSITTTISTKDMLESLGDCEDLNGSGSSGEEETNEVTTESLLNFVDLAGSERASSISEISNPFDTVINEATKKAGQSLKFKRSTTLQKTNQFDTLMTEGRHINTSLFYLQQVITRLSEKKGNMDHIPYRNSNLTKLLRSSLGGNAKTCIICTATQTLTQFEMTLSTLRFGGTASTITNKVAANIKSDKNAEILAAYARDIDSLRSELDSAMRRGNENSTEAEAVRKQLEARIAKLTGMLFSQSKQELPDSKETIDKTIISLWSGKAGDLALDSRLVRDKHVKEHELKFDEKAELAMERMKQMNAQIKEKNREIAEMKNNLGEMNDSHETIHVQMKKLLKHQQALKTEKSALIQKAHTAQGRYENMWSSLQSFADCSVFDNLGTGELGDLESCLFQMLDTVKNIRIRKMIETGEDPPAPTGRGIIEILQIGSNNENVYNGSDENIPKSPEKLSDICLSPTKAFGESLLNFAFN